MILDDDLKTVIHRIAARPASDIEASILEFSNHIPRINGKPVIRIRDEVVEELLPGLGRGLNTYLDVSDSVIGERSFLLECYDYLGTEAFPTSGADKLIPIDDKWELYKKTESSLDTSDNLYKPAKAAVIECLEALYDPWIVVRLQDMKLNKSTIGRHIKKFDYIRSTDIDGFFQVRQSRLPPLP